MLPHGMPLSRTQHVIAADRIAVPRRCASALARGAPTREGQRLSTDKGARKAAARRESAGRRISVDNHTTFYLCCSIDVCMLHHDTAEWQMAIVLWKWRGQMPTVAGRRNVERAMRRRVNLVKQSQIGRMRQAAAWRALPEHGVQNEAKLAGSSSPRCGRSHTGGGEKRGNPAGDAERACKTKPISGDCRRSLGCPERTLCLTGPALRIPRPGTAAAHLRIGAGVEFRLCGGGGSV
jgi:hypothetical protein